MRIVIDMQGAQTESRFRGIGRYSLSFAQALVRNCGDHEIILALSGLFPDTIEPMRAAFNDLLPQHNIRVWHSPGPVREMQTDNDWRRKTAELVREAFLASLQPDVIHICSLFEGFDDDAVTSIGRFDQSIPVSVTLHDLIPLLNPVHYLKPNPAFEGYYHRKIEFLKQASIFLAVSDSSREEGIQGLGRSAEFFVNTSEAVEPYFQPQTIVDTSASKFKQGFGITRPFVLYTGGSDDRKNLPRLVEAYAALQVNLRNRHQLVFAGRMRESDIADFKDAARSAGMKPDELIFTDYVTDEDLVQLYNLCQLYVFPSWHEGFGLPALEAMACGAPVIGANTSSLPEVIGYEAALFDPFDVNSISAKLEHALADDQFRDDLRAHGLRQAKLFSWDRTAQLAIHAFESIPKSHQVNCLDIGLVVKQLMQKVSKFSDTKVPDSDLRGLAYAVDQSFPEKTSRQIFVDISELVQCDARTGVQRVTRAILQQLLLAPPDGYEVQPVYATIDQPGYRYARKYMQAFCEQVEISVDEPIATRPGDIFLGLDLQHHTTRVQEQYLAASRQNGVAVYFVIYDLLPIQFPDYWPEQHSVDKVHSDWLYAICKFDGVVCISRAVADELKVWLEKNSPPRLRPLAIKWFHLGADVDNSVPSKGMPGNADDVLTLINSRPAFLNVGTIEPRKGQAQSLAAFELLWQAGLDINLVLVGKQGWMMKALVDKIRSHSEFGQRLFWLEGISDEYLEAVYMASTCLIASSEGEGFGLPLIEAAQHKLPIIARDIPVFREVAGDYASYFSGFKAADLADVISSWLDAMKNGTVIHSDQMPWLTWQESAAQLLANILDDGFEKNP